MGSSSAEVVGLVGALHGTPRSRRVTHRRGRHDERLRTGAGSIPADLITVNLDASAEAVRLRSRGPPLRAPVQYPLRGTFATTRASACQANFRTRARASPLAPSPSLPTPPHSSEKCLRTTKIRADLAPTAALSRADPAAKPQVFFSIFQHFQFSRSTPLPPPNAPSKRALPRACTGVADPLIFTPAHSPAVIRLWIPSA